MKYFKIFVEVPGFQIYKLVLILLVCFYTKNTNFKIFWNLIENEQHLLLTISSQNIIYSIPFARDEINDIWDEIVNN